MRALSILISVFILTHALVPTLPKYLCLGMGGVHVLQKCCPEEDGLHEGAEYETTLRDARCCQSLPKAASGAQWAPRSEIKLIPPLLVGTTVPIEAPPLRWRECIVRIVARGDPPPLGPPPPLHRILRI